MGAFVHANAYSRKPLSGFFEYIQAVFGHWLALMSAGPFFLDRMITWFSSNGRKWLDQWPHRRRTLAVIMAIGVFLAGFQTWKEERGSAQKEETLLAIKDILGKSISDGEKLFIECRKPDQKQCEADVLAWGTKADDFVLAAFGAGEQALFESLAGYTFLGGTVARNKLDGSIRRLNDLLQRTSTVPLRKEFDPSKFR
jgi:hypothetical protein